MKLNNQAFLLISICSLILSFSVQAQIFSPSPSPSPSPATTPLSYISSSPGASPASAPSPSPAATTNDDHISVVLASHVKKGAADAELTLAFLAERAKDTSINPMESECLAQCVDNYGAIFDDFKKAQDDVKSRDYYLLSEDLSAVSADIDACQDCFKEMLGGDSPLGKFEESIKVAANSGLDILQLTS